MLAYLLMSISKLATVLRWLLFAIVLIILVSLSQNYLTTPIQSPYLVKVIDFQNEMTAGLDKNINKLIPTSVGNTNITKLIGLLLFLIAASYLKNLFLENGLLEQIHPL